MLVSNGKIVADLESFGKSASVSRIQGKGEFFFSEAVIESPEFFFLRFIYF